MSFEWKITEAQYGLLVESFRRQPQIQVAALHANVTHRCAKRAYHSGFDQWAWGRPIKVLLAEERQPVRAQLALRAQQAESQAVASAAAARAQATLAGIDAAAERAREAQGVRATMQIATSALAVSGTLHPLKVQLSRQTAQKLEAAMTAGTISWEAGMELLERLTAFDARVIGTFRQAMELLRLHTGEPERFIAHMGYDPQVQIGPVDTATVVAAMGGEQQVRQALRDLVDGRMTPLADRLMSLQASKRLAPAAPSHKAR